MELTQNPSVLELVQKTAELTTPKEIVWIDGSEAQLESLRKIAVETGELIKLNEEKLPGCYLNRSDVNDVARVEGRTFICSRTREEAGPTNNWMDPDEMKAKLHEILRCAMAGRTMYVIPYSMGVIGSPFAKYGIEVTDSIYVVLNMAIMTRIGTKVLDALGDSSDVILGVHSKVTLDPENRYIVHFPEENKIISVNSNYGGNVLQGKKCFSLRIASVLGRREGWLAEHMLILGIQNPKGEVRYVTGAFPSACGKTNLAMLIPPEGYRKNGWKCWTVGDDIAWLRVGPDGRLWAVNPENGFFGVAPGTSERSNPNALASTSKNTIFTNVVLNEDDMTVWWEGMTKRPPKGHLRNWKGEVWDGSDGTRGAHPNSRFTAPAENCPCISEEFFKGTGVPISAIIFGGRRAKTAPLVYQSRDWAHGVRLFERALLHARDKAVEPLALRAQPGKNLADEEHDERHRHEVAEDGHRDGDAVIQAVRHADWDRAAQLEHRHHGDEEGHKNLPKQAVPNLQIRNPPEKIASERQRRKRTILPAPSRSGLRLSRSSSKMHTACAIFQPGSCRTMKSVCTVSRMQFSVTPTT